MESAFVFHCPWFGTVSGRWLVTFVWVGQRFTCPANQGLGSDGVVVGSRVGSRQWDRMCFVAVWTVSLATSIWVVARDSRMAKRRGERNASLDGCIEMVLPRPGGQEAEQETKERTCTWDGLSVGREERTGHVGRGEEGKGREGKSIDERGVQFPSDCASQGREKDGQRGCCECGQGGM